ncbi:unnamed protein product [Didymodactylos carnosus]|uniref:Uncharacterized protein n=1 Tax=Didymodactylos carnosus TaxID=1234261 RepID=A0A813XYD8_9BILA|nr:unnamed protein product [Didymodactylos carnosus]CAF3664278.1 unnamed protein product [Didymodactylos carnosus]
MIKNVGRMEKQEIDTLEPYLERRQGFNWLPQANVDNFDSSTAVTSIKLTPSQELDRIPDYLIWSIGNFILLFILGIICIILSVRVREHKAERDFYKKKLVFYYRKLLRKKKDMSGWIQYNQAKRLDSFLPTTTENEPYHSHESTQIRFNDLIHPNDNIRSSFSNAGQQPQTAYTNAETHASTVTAVVNEINKYPKQIQNNHYQENGHSLLYVNKSPIDKCVSDSKHNDDNDIMYKTESYLKYRDTIEHSQRLILNHSSDDDQNYDEDQTNRFFTRQNNNTIEDNDELERVLSSVDSIHNSLNKCLLLPYDKVFPLQYSSNNSLMGRFGGFTGSEESCDDDDSSVISEINEQNDVRTQMSSLFENRFSDTDDDELDNTRPEQYDQPQVSYHDRDNDNYLKALLKDYSKEDKQNPIKSEKHHYNRYDSGYSSQNFSFYNYIQNETDKEMNKSSFVPSRTKANVCLPKRQYPFKKLTYTRISLEEVMQHLNKFLNN